MPHAAKPLIERPPRTDDNRPDATARGYGYRWQLARRRHLARFPLCAECLAAGLVVVATIVDHIVPHRGDMTLFWDASNWQSLCETCHNRKTARGE